MGCCTSCEKGKGCASSSGLSDLAPIFCSPRDAEALFLVGGMAFFLRPGVPQKVAWRLSVRRGSQNASQAYEMGECRAVRLSVVRLGFVGSVAASVIVEGSLDKANWQTISTMPAAGLGYLSMSVTGITFRWVRLRYTAPSSLSFTSLNLTATLVGSRF
ncbi:MAG: hypothetical protein FD180_2810 [Planctomycetota bacterium]|nr:MAG: hypothetical protein FD180_2810 [Planctomycetota bacterium]